MSACIRAASSDKVGRNMEACAGTCASVCVCVDAVFFRGISSSDSVSSCVVVVVGCAVMRYECA